MPSVVLRTSARRSHRYWSMGRPDSSTAGRSGDCCRRIRKAMAAKPPVTMSQAETAIPMAGWPGYSPTILRKLWTVSAMLYFPSCPISARVRRRSCMSASIEDRPSLVSRDISGSLGRDGSAIRLAQYTLSAPEKQYERFH